MNDLITTLKRQLPTAKIHELGSAALVIVLGLLAYFEYVGDDASAEKALIALLAMLIPAPVRSNNNADGGE